MELSRYNFPAAALACCALFLLPAARARGADVRMLNGESYDGKVQFNSNQIVVVTKSGTTRIEIPDMLDAVFNDDRNNKAGMLMPGVLLANGSLIGGNVQGVTDPIKVANASIPLSAVAWVVFQQIARDKITQPSKGQTGVILPTGDFFPGVIAGIKDDRVAINSALFGPQRFSIRGRADIAALVLRDVQDNGARYEVTAKNGSMYVVNDLKIEGDTLVISDVNFGTVKISRDDIVEIRIARGQYQYLAGVKPDRVNAAAGADTANAVQAPQNEDGTLTENLQTTVNVAVTYAVPKGFATFSTGVDVPQGGPPGAKYTFAVYGDGKFLLTQTPAVGAGDNAQHLSVPVANLHTITLLVEPASVGAATGSGQWVQPLFLRQ